MYDDPPPHLDAGVLARPSSLPCLHSQHLYNRRKGASAHFAEYRRRGPHYRRWNLVRVMFLRRDSLPRTILVFSFSLLSLPVFAEEDPMELQRCIWQCQANYGTESAKYPDCVERLCEGGGREQKRDAAIKQEGRWTYGDHPVLGRSAYVEIGDAALGVACVAGEGSFVISERMTSGVVKDPNLPDGSGVMTLFRKPFAVGGSYVYQMSPAGFFEKTATYCDSSLAQLQRSSSLIFLSGRFVGLEYANDVYKMTVEQAGQSIAISSDADLEKLSDSRTISLAGSSAAIKQLTKECPALRQQIAEVCDEF